MSVANKTARPLVLKAGTFLRPCGGGFVNADRFVLNGHCVTVGIEDFV